MEPTPPLPATPDPQAAGLLSVERLNEIRKAHAEVCMQMQKERVPSPRTVLLDAIYDRQDLLAHIEAQSAIMQEMQDEFNAEAETCFHDQRKYRELVRDTLLRLTVGQWPLLQSQEHPFLQAYSARIHEAARALGLKL